MSENTETTTVQQYRHRVRKELTEGRSLLSLRNEGTKEVYGLINGPLDVLLKGASGYTQAEQVEKLTSVRDSLAENINALPEAIAAAKAEVLEQVEAWEADILAHANTALKTVTKAATFAAERDFEAHQKAKAENRRAQYSEVDDEDVQDEYDEDVQDEYDED